MKFSQRYKKVMKVWIPIMLVLNLCSTFAKVASLSDTYGSPPEGFLVLMIFAAVLNTLLWGWLWGGFFTLIWAGIAKIRGV